MKGAKGAYGSKEGARSGGQTAAPITAKGSAAGPAKEAGKSASNVAVSAGGWSHASQKAPAKKGGTHK